MLRFPACLPLLAAFALAACASDTVNYPSLATRDVERIANTAPSPGPIATAPADPALDSRLAGLVNQAEAAHDRFASRRARAEALTSAASGAVMASEAWATATVALAELESARSTVMVTLADLDQLHAAAVVAGQPSAALAEARERVTALVREEDRVLRALSGRLAD